MNKAKTIFFLLMFVGIPIYGMQNGNAVVPQRPGEGQMVTVQSNQTGQQASSLNTSYLRAIKRPFRCKILPSRSRC